MIIPVPVPLRAIQSWHGMWLRTMFDLWGHFRNYFTHRDRLYLSLMIIMVEIGYRMLSVIRDQRRAQRLQRLLDALRDLQRTLNQRRVLPSDQFCLRDRDLQDVNRICEEMQKARRDFDRRSTGSPRAKRIGRNENKKVRSHLLSRGSKFRI